MENLVKFVQEEFVSKNEFPEFAAGDTITVYYEITEGKKTRTQFFKGVVIQKAELADPRPLRSEKCRVQSVWNVSSRSTCQLSKKLR